MKLQQQTKFKGHRNLKMIELLEAPDVLGAFLFFLAGPVGDQQPGFVTPPGLTEQEAKDFTQEFYALFGKYAVKFEERRSKKQ